MKYMEVTMFGKKETEVKELFLNHVNSVKKALMALHTALTCYINKDIECARTKGYEVHIAESEADTYRRNVIKKLYSGAFLPMIREDLIRFIAHQDKIADRAESCSDFCMTQKPKIPEQFNENILTLLNLSIDVFKPYTEAIGALLDKKSSYEEVKMKIHEVNTSEEKADTAEWHLIEDIFNADIPLYEKMHLRELVFHIVNISDVIEDAADDIDLLMVKQQV